MPLVKMGKFRVITYKIWFLEGNKDSLMGDGGVSNPLQPKNRWGKRGASAVSGSTAFRSACRPAARATESCAAGEGRSSNSLQ
jgi:hypothetical protein